MDWLDQDHDPMGSRPAQPGECHIISAYTEQLYLSPGHIIIVAANKYDPLLSPEVENNYVHISLWNISEMHTGPK